MKFRFLIFIPLLLAVSCSPFLAGTRSEEGITEDVTQRTLGARITDESIETRIRTNLAAQESTLAASNIDVTAHNGVVLLVGQVPSPEMKRRAADIASEASSQIRRIHDELEVTGNTGFLARGNDALIATRVRTLLLTGNIDVDADIRVVTENGTVFLMGVLSREQGDEVAALISDINGVTRVVKVFEYLN